MDIRSPSDGRPRRSPRVCERCHERADLALVRSLVTPTTRRRRSFDGADLFEDEGLDAFADEAGPNDRVRQAEMALERAQRAYEAARREYRLRVQQQQVAVQNVGTYGEAEVERRRARAEAASRALLRAGDAVTRARRALSEAMSRGPYR